MEVFDGLVDDRDLRAHSGRGEEARDFGGMLRLRKTPVEGGERIGSPLCVLCALCVEIILCGLRELRVRIRLRVRSRRSFVRFAPFFPSSTAPSLCAA